MSRDVSKPGALRDRLRWVLVGALAALGACSSADTGDRVTTARRFIAERLRQVLHLDAVAIACPEVDDPAAGFECIGKARGRDAFLIEVAPARDDGAEELDWKLRGTRHIEYQLALDVAERVGVAPESVTCPDMGDVAAGFDCRITLPGAIEATAAISAGPRPDSFRWVAPDLLMIGVIEDRIASDLAAEGRDATVDCGPAVRRSVPETSFSCSIAFAGGGAGSATVYVLDREGHVQYRLDPGNSRAAAARCP